MWTTKFNNTSPFWFYMFHVWYGSFDHRILTEQSAQSIPTTVYSRRICFEIHFKIHENMSLIRRNLIIWNRSHRIIQVNGCNHDLFDSFPDLEHNLNADFLQPRIQFAKLKKKSSKRCIRRNSWKEKKMSNWQSERNQSAISHECHCNLRTSRKL